MQNSDAKRLKGRGLLCRMNKKFQETYQLRGYYYYYYYYRYYYHYDHHRYFVCTIMFFIMQ